MFFVEDGEIRIAMRQSVGTSQYLDHSLTDRYSDVRNVNDVSDTVWLGLVLVLW